MRLLWEVAICESDPALRKGQSPSRRARTSFSPRRDFLRSLEFRLSTQRLIEGDRRRLYCPRVFLNSAPRSRWKI
jgi:hypothetical protein